MTRLVVHLPGGPKGQPRGRHVPAGKGRFRIPSNTVPKIEPDQTRLEGVMRKAAKAQASAIRYQAPEAGQGKYFLKSS